MRPLDLPCGEQGKLHSAKALKLAERDKHMSEQKQPSFLEKELDDWVEAAVFDPLAEGASAEFRKEFLPQIQSAIRGKVAESYCLGYQAGVSASQQKGGLNEA